ncbi:hypothetical protein HHI36_005477 [Cryptolaemus montrouzieri]|uniref:Probable tRNA(His) guanylyltransferase n=1 Tax=Cryptolaemus montrouzieri TaxID=559131 RepID=A0ABD2NUJ8_9CUCU
MTIGGIRKYKELLRFFHRGRMAKSKFEYVKSFESEDKLLPNCWIVVRVDGKSFHKFSEKHEFEKPNDIRALHLMNRAAVKVMEHFKDIVISYGDSDEFSFILRKDTEIFNRRGFKIMTYINSLFSSSYVYCWKQHFDVKLKFPPFFDARIILYPTDENLRDYLSWRQVDCHINNLYNTTFWALVLKGGLTNQEAEKRLCGTVTADKNEILFSEFNINYNDEPEIFKKGTILLRKKIRSPNSDHFKKVIIPLHEDLISEKFWNIHSEILTIKSGQEYAYDSVEALPELVLSQLHLVKKDKCNDEIKST